MRTALLPLAALAIALLPAAGRGAMPTLPAGIAPCESCHGARGEGNAALGAPRIAAQSQAYLARQLTAFADGSRNSPVMTPIAKALAETQRQALAAHYASLASPGPASARGAKASERGRLLATRGDATRGIQACANCHGPEGIGEPPGYPYLAGQQGAYLVAALKAWRDGSRNTDPSGQMPTIAKRLTDGDVRALADYYGAAAPPGPETFRTARGPARAPAAAPGSQGAAPSRPGGKPGAVGTEQGEPTTGGSQGPGGGGATTEERGR